jgi:hypothetical protein
MTTTAYAPDSIEATYDLAAQMLRFHWPVPIGPEASVRMWPWGLLNEEERQFWTQHRPLLEDVIQYQALSLT